MKTYLSIFCLFLLGICCSTPLSAAHIIGGEITYECLGDGSNPNTRRYQFIMTIYRDCAGGGADFDSGPSGAFEATVSIYKESDSDNPVENLILGGPDVTLIDPNAGNPCLIVPPDICVQEGIYVFPVLELPIINESYHVAYQRCCRNNTISNIHSPDDTGATFSIEVTAQAQTLCNNSPVFNNFPPPVICAGEPLSFDHSATDADGDQLVYEFCSPLRGGGTNSNNASDMNGIAPDPDAPPPYAGVAFILPEYSSLMPLGGESGVVIDENTGVITGTPTTTGQFVVGVCVSEYRNGELLSVVRRDFQFNVEPCVPTVVASIAADEVNELNEFIINSCGENTVSFNNESFQQQFIDAFEWTFDIDNTITTSSQWNPTVTFPDIGTYQGMLVLNPGTTCNDTAIVEINIYPEIIADFEYQYDTCIAGPVAFTDLSSSGSGTIEQWFWNYGDNNDSAEQEAEHTYETPGNFPVTLRVHDINNCIARVTKQIDYFPVPNLIIISPSTFLGCAPADIYFDNLSTPIDETYDIVWDFGDGTTGTDISPLHTYETPGVFDVAVDITSPIGCQTDTLFPLLIEVEPSPMADFVYSPANPSNFAPTITLVDQSMGANEWLWLFDEVHQSTEQNPTFTFPDTGQHTIQLIVTHASGCLDTALQVLDVKPEIRFYLPNAFTPNNDSKNDVFQASGVFSGMQDFSLTIWNRWGELIFETNNPEVAWNGRKNNVNQMSAPGVYIYQAKFKGPRGKQFEYKGFATLIR